MEVNENSNQPLLIHDGSFGQLRRYLVDIDSISTHQLFTDCLVIGSGIAGLRAAIEAAANCNVTIVCKASLADSNTWSAQGGIAAVLDETDSYEAHIADTLKTGCDLNDRKVVELVVREGPKLIKQLLDWGTEFDMKNGSFAMTLEGGHSHPRIAHAHGDQTGRIIAQCLLELAKKNPNIKIIENCYAIDLLTDDNNRCLGVIGQDQRGIQIIWAANTILASGGAGQLYRETSNPSVATGDGLSMAWRAGAILADLEFVQFHPTTLYIAGASRALITEALRGEGAKLLDIKGRPFMKDYHPDAELAPRDIVSRACLSQMLKTKSTHVYLDVRNFDKKYFSERFPQIFELCDNFGIDISRDLIPVRPSAHYMIGGVKTDLSAKTNIENLYACGEVAATGLHGANRLASNALLEGLVFGRIAGQQASQSAGSKAASIRPHIIKYKIPHSERSALDTADVRNSLRALMWRNVGITRRSNHLIEAQQIIKFWHRYVMDKVFDAPAGWECQNMLTICLFIARFAQMRRESRGVHYRTDFPQIDNENFQRHIELSTKLSV